MSGRRRLGLLGSQGRSKVCGNCHSFLHQLIICNVYHINIYIKISRELQLEFQPTELMPDSVHQPYSIYRIYSDIGEIEQSAADQVCALEHAPSLALRFRIARRPVISLSIWRVCKVRELNIRRIYSS